eukprot:CAMPEP_0116920918 /NCGR_PEP_ID=MMETSP0467-20121206/21310_1 /TAXON_ID=283647 /ORGANISM="Mesodinium pulex, Strain SPMC105" /LENGTH=96 /DNA_ID=CAMNT_0004598865 /DNA_START=595 /DNA_END=885 /DNA_ORIENTATION=-
MPAPRVYDLDYVLAADKQEKMRKQRMMDAYKAIRVEGLTENQVNPANPANPAEGLKSNTLTDQFGKPLQEDPAVADRFNSMLKMIIRDKQVPNGQI